MFCPSYSALCDWVRAAGAPWWTEPDDLNLVGLRGPDQVDAWCDLMVAAYTSPSGTGVVWSAPMTTRPGREWRLAPGRPEGVAILDKGHHPKLWRPGLHKGRPALVQNAPARLLRDPDRDLICDPPPTTTMEVVGINCHDGAGAARVGLYSAGCQVLWLPRDVRYLLELVAAQKAAGHGEVVSFTVLEVQ